MTADAAPRAPSDRPAAGGPRHALAFDLEAVHLMEREGREWAWRAAARYDTPDLGGRLERLRRTLDGNWREVALLIPDDQILFTELEVDPALPRRRAVERRLEGLTPYAVEELDYDWLDEAPDRVRVAAVWRGTLREAQSFAEAQGFVPVAAMTEPGRGGFPAGARFGGRGAAAAASLRAVPASDVEGLSEGPTAGFELAAGESPAAAVASALEAEVSVAAEEAAEAEASATAADAAPAEAEDGAAESVGVAGATPLPAAEAVPADEAPGEAPAADGTEQQADADAAGDGQVEDSDGEADGTAEVVGSDAPQAGPRRGRRRQNGETRDIESMLARIRAVSEAGAASVNAPHVLPEDSAATEDNGPGHEASGAAPAAATELSPLAEPDDAPIAAEGELPETVPDAPEAAGEAPEGDVRHGPPEPPATSAAEPDAAAPAGPQPAEAATETPARTDRPPQSGDAAATPAEAAAAGDQSDAVREGEAARARGRSRIGALRAEAVRLGPSPALGDAGGGAAPQPRGAAASAKGWAARLGGALLGAGREPDAKQPPRPVATRPAAPSIARARPQPPAPSPATAATAPSAPAMPAPADARARAFHARVREAREAGMPVPVAQPARTTVAERCATASGGLMVMLGLLVVGLLAVFLVVGKERADPAPGGETPLAATAPAPAPVAEPAEAEPVMAEAPAASPPGPAAVAVMPEPEPEPESPPTAVAPPPQEPAPAAGANAGTALPAPVAAAPVPARAGEPAQAAVPAPPAVVREAPPVARPAATAAPPVAPAASPAPPPAATPRNQPASAPATAAAAPAPRPEGLPASDADAIAEALALAVSSAPEARPAPPEAEVAAEPGRGAIAPRPPATTDVVPVVPQDPLPFDRADEAEPSPVTGIRPPARPAAPEAAPPTAQPSPAGDGVPLPREGAALGGTRPAAGQAALRDAARPPARPSAPAPAPAEEARLAPAAALAARRTASAAPVGLAPADLPLFALASPAPPRSAVDVGAAIELALRRATPSGDGPRLAQDRPPKKLPGSDAVDAAVAAAVETAGDVPAARPAARAAADSAPAGRPRARPGRDAGEPGPAATGGAAVQGAIAAAIAESPAAPGGVSLTALRSSPSPERRPAASAPAEAAAATEPAPAAASGAGEATDAADEARRAQQRKLDEQLQAQAEARIRARAAADAKVEAQQRAAAEARARAQAEAEERAAARANQPARPAEIDNEPELVGSAAGAATTQAVAANATTTGLDLRRTTLIGVVGAGPASRGLIRLRNGRIVTVRLGDRIDGGPISAIGDGAVTYVKGGRPHQLRILDGR